MVWDFSHERGVPGQTTRGTYHLCLEMKWWKVKVKEMQEVVHELELELELKMIVL